MAYTSLFRELLTYMMEDARAITPCTHLLFIAKNLERVGDHVTNIAENIWFQVHADAPLPPRAKRDENNTATCSALTHAARKSTARTGFATHCRPAPGCAVLYRATDLLPPHKGLTVARKQHAGTTPPHPTP